MYRVEVREVLDRIEDPCAVLCRYVAAGLVVELVATLFLLGATGRFALHAMNKEGPLVALGGFLKFYGIFFLFPFLGAIAGRYLGLSEGKVFGGTGIAAGMILLGAPWSAKPLFACFLLPVFLGRLGSHCLRSLGFPRSPVLLFEVVSVALWVGFLSLSWVTNVLFGCGG